MAKAKTKTKGAKPVAKKPVAKAKPAKKSALKAAKTAVKGAAKAVKKAAKKALAKVQKAVAPAAPQPGPGSVVHVEFHAPDINAAKSFWEQFLGLNFHPMGPNEFYFHGKTGWGAGGCLVQGPASNTIAPVLYWQVDDIPKALARAESLGATQVKEKTEIPGNHGFFAHFRTAEGNLFGLWSRA